MSIPAAASAAPAAADDSPSGQPVPGVSPSATPIPTGPVAFEYLLVDGTYTNAKICDAYVAKISSYTRAANGRIASGADDAQGPYEAAAYRRSHSWVKDDLADRFDASIRATARKALDSVTGNRSREVGSIDPYLQDSIESCGLDSALAKARTQSRKADALGDRIVRQARLKPWYPKGYRSLGDELAYTWVGSPNCDYYTRCSEAYFVAKDGCYGGLYVEVNFYDGGTIVDWTNDVASSLPARSRAKLKFSSYSSNANSTRISDWSCY